MRTIHSMCMALTVSLMIMGCHGMRISLQGTDVEAPVSFTDKLFNDNLEVLDRDNYSVIDTLALCYHRYGFVFGLLTIGGAVDISEEINDEIRRSNADGVVNLRYEYYIPDGGYVTYLIAMVPASYSTVGILGGNINLEQAVLGYALSLIVPQIVAVRVSGDLIKLNKEKY